MCGEGHFSYYNLPDALPKPDHKDITVKNTTTHPRLRAHNVYVSALLLIATRKVADAV